MLLRFNSWPSLCKINCVTCSVYLWIAKPINFKMFCFVVLLMDGTVLAGFTKSIFCWSWAGSHPGYLASWGPSAQPGPAVDALKVFYRHRGFWASIRKRPCSPSRGSAGRSLAGAWRKGWFLQAKFPSLLSGSRCAEQLREESGSRDGMWGW